VVSQLLIFFCCSRVVSRWKLLPFYWKCCFLNGFWHVFVVIISLVWSLVFFRRNDCFFFFFVVWSLVFFFQLLTFFVTWWLLAGICCFFPGSAVF